jgi:hypothetical protein
VARRKVTHSQKKAGRYITGLCGPSFGFRSTKEVILDIKESRHTYFVREGPFETEVKVVSGEGGLDLVSTRDVLSRNNLLNLPAEDLGRSRLFDPVSPSHPTLDNH